MTVQKEETNQIYKIAKQISSATNEVQENELILELSNLLATKFEQSEPLEIEEAITKALDEDNIELTNIILDEANFEIENLCIETPDGKELDSTMQLMPCVLMSAEKNLLLPSLNEIEESIRTQLVEAKIIESPQQFHLGTIFLSQEEVDRFSLLDWWKTHRDIIEEDSSKNKVENAQIRANKIRINMTRGISMFFFVPVIVREENNDKILDNIFDSYIDVDFWNNLSHKMQLGDYGMLIFPPMAIADTMSDTKIIMQDIEFGLFFEEHSSEENVEIGYIKLEDKEDNYAVIFFDGDAQLLFQFYRYETEDDPSGFVAMLIEKCIEQKKTLYSFNSTITQNTLKAWAHTSEAVDITKLMKDSNQIDLEKASKIINPGNSYLSDYNTEQTIH